MIQPHESPALGRYFVTDEWPQVNRPFGRIVFHRDEIRALKKEAADLDVWQAVVTTKAVFPGAYVIAHIDGPKRRARYEKTWAKSMRFGRPKNQQWQDDASVLPDDDV
jgi:hypothetical protein